jgi:uncharacterized protein (DUF2237 family)
MTNTNRLNVLGEPLACCGTAQIIGFYRDGYCHTDRPDVGRHIAAATVAPPVRLDATHAHALDFISLETPARYAQP